MRRKIFSIRRTLLYLTILAGFIGFSLRFFVINLGPFSIFPYRVLLPLLWLISLLYVFINHGKISINHIKIKPYIWFLMLWFSYAVLSLIWAASPIDAAKEIIILFMGISTIFFVVYYFTDIEHLKLLYYLWLLALVASTGVGIWNCVTGQTLIPGEYVIRLPGGRFGPTSFYAFPNNFAVFLSLSIPFALTFIRYYNRFIARFLFVVVLLLAFLLLIATTARSCYLAVLSSIVFWFLFLLKPKAKFRVLAIASLIILLLFISFTKNVLYIYSIVYEQLASIGSTWEIQGTSLYLRINMIKNGLHFLIKSWGVGVGSGNAEYYMSHLSVYDVGGNPYVHNWWIQILTNYGIFIFGCYIAFYINLFLNLYRAHCKLVDSREKMICEALLIGMVAFFFAGMSTGTITYFIPQWIFFAFALAFLNYYRIKPRIVSSHGAIGTSHA